MRKDLHSIWRRSRFSMILIVGARLSIGQQAQGGHASATFPWPATLGEAQLSDRVERARVESFLNSAKPIGVPDLRVGEFRFTPLEGARFCLVATIDTSGREMFFALAVVYQSGRDGFRMTVLPSAPPHLLGAELIDITGEGVCEVVTKELAGGYEGTQTLPLYWYSVFRVKDGVPRDESAKYRQFYAHRLLPELEFMSNLLVPVSPAPKGIAAHAHAEAQFLREKYERRIEGNRTAGIDDAVQWARSDDPRLQMLAVQTLQDIDIPAAVDALEKLKNTKDLVVSQAAANALQSKREERR